MKVSLITPTYKHQHFMKLAYNNYKKLDLSFLPDTKIELEWIILDDNEKPSEIPDDPNIKYYHYDQETIKKMYDNLVNFVEKRRKEYKMNKNNSKKYKLKFKKPFKHLPIGMKRNICCQYATGDFILHFDDDDYYPPSTIQKRLEYLFNKETECVGCCTIGCFNIEKYISVVIKPPENLLPSKRVAVGSLGYSKDFWRNRKFDNQDVNNEGEYFLKNRLFKDIDYRGVIIGLYHQLNNHTNIFNGESNGWHFDKLDDKLFLLITSLKPYTNDILK